MGENNDGKTPGQVAINEKVKEMLGSTNNDLMDIASSPKFVPNYLQHPPLGYQVDVPSVIRNKSNESVIANNQINEHKSTTNTSSIDKDTTILILKIRVADCLDRDFIEIDIENNQLNYQSLKDVMCHELGVNSAQVERIRKLPNTKLRRDIEVSRLQNYAELELVLSKHELE